MELVRTVLAHRGHINHTLYAAQAGLLLSAGMDNLVKLWALPEFGEVATLAGHDASVNALALDGAETQLATSSSDSTLRIWSFPDGTLARTATVPRTAVSGVLTSPGGALLAWICSARQVLRLFDLTSDETLLEAADAPKRLSRVLFTPDGRQLLLAGLGSDVQLWDLATGHLARSLAGHETAVMSALFTPGGRQLLTAGYERALRLWDVATWQQVGQVALSVAGQYPLAISADGQRLYLGVEHAVRRCRLPDLSLAQEVAIPPKGVYTATLSPDGRWLVVGAADKQLRLFDLAGDGDA